MLTRLENATGIQRFALRWQHADHVHLVCRQCGQEVEAEANLFETLTAEIQRRYGFVPDLVQRAVSGICRACASQAERGEFI
jgi:Fur family ferric uptake transcriptional regulator